jgi:hypothetical protein
MNVEIGTVATLFPEKEYINANVFAVYLWTKKITCPILFSDTLYGQDGITYIYG